MKFDENALESVKYLPETGEITYDAWKKAIRDAEQFDLITATRTAKKQGLVKFRNVMDENGDLTLYVSRASQ